MSKITHLLLLQCGYILHENCYDRTQRNGILTETPAYYGEYYSVGTYYMRIVMIGHKEMVQLLRHQITMVSITVWVHIT